MDLVVDKVLADKEIGEVRETRQCVEGRGDSVAGREKTVQWAIY